MPFCMVSTMHYNIFSQKNNTEKQSFQGFVVASRLWSGGGSGGLTTHTVGVNIVTGEKLIQDIIGKAH